MNLFRKNECIMMHAGFFKWFFRLIQVCFKQSKSAQHNQFRNCRVNQLACIRGPRMRTTTCWNCELIFMPGCDHVAQLKNLESSGCAAGCIAGEKRITCSWWMQSICVHDVFSLAWFRDSTARFWLQDFSKYTCKFENICDQKTNKFIDVAN